MVAGVTLFTAAAAPAAAQDSVPRNEAPVKTDAANFTVDLPYATDHYPGDQNQENASMEYNVVGSEAFTDLGAEEGIFIHYSIIDANWIDHSRCDTANTRIFGIDRGNNNSGTQVNEDLVAHQRNTDFRTNGTTIGFYDWNDFAGDPPYMAPEDAIVRAVGAGSQDGPCLTMPSEPGWYQVQWFINGTVADNGPNEQPSENAEEIGFKLQSNYFYVCECANETEAREQLGPPPNETDSPSAGDYANQDGVIETDGLRDGIDDWRSGDIDTTLLRDVIGFWRSSEVVS